MSVTTSRLQLEQVADVLGRLDRAEDVEVSSSQLDGDVERRHVTHQKHAADGRHLAHDTRYLVVEHQRLADARAVPQVVPAALCRENTIKVRLFHSKLISR